VVLVAELAAVVTAVAIGRFVGGASVAWSLGAGVFEGGYFLLLVAALSRAPLGVAYTVSRGVAILAVWPISVLWLAEPLTAQGLAGTALLLVGLLVTAPVRGTDGLGLAVLCGLCISGYHLCYKQAMTGEANPAAVFALSLAVALPINLARARLPALAHALRTRPLPIVGAGALCGASFLIFLVALGQAGAGFVLTLRNTSIVFATLLGWAIGDPPSRRQVAGAILVTIGAACLVP